MTNPPDDRSLLARATECAANTTTVAAEMVVPILIGAWIDGRLGTKGAFAVLGGILGVTVGIWSLLRMVPPLRRSPGKTADRHDRTRNAPP